jgi:hypothetical protein
MYGTRAELGAVGDVSGIFDVIKSIASTVIKGARVVQQGVTATIHPPGLPPVSIDLTSPDALTKAKNIIAALAKSITIQTGGAPPPSVANQLTSQAFAGIKSFVTSPIGLATVAGLAILLTSRRRRRA